mgnify:CR=1
RCSIFFLSRLSAKIFSSPLCFLSHIVAKAVDRWLLYLYLNKDVAAKGRRSHIPLLPHCSIHPSYILGKFARNVSE